MIANEMIAESSDPGDEMAELRKFARSIPCGGARSVREAAQKECDADSRAHDALLARGNQLLAAAGVAVSLLVGLTVRAEIDTWIEKAFFVVALGAASLVALLVVFAARVMTAKASTDNANLVGCTVPPVQEGERDDNWVRDYELSMALHYCEIRLSLRKRHNHRASLLEWAQRAYVVFLAAVAGLGLAVLF